VDTFFIDARLFTPLNGNLLFRTGRACQPILRSPQAFLLEVPTLVPDCPAMNCVLTKGKGRGRDYFPWMLVYLPRNGILLFQGVKPSRSQAFAWQVPTLVPGVQRDLTCVLTNVKEGCGPFFSILVHRSTATCCFN
jgi:hypothetical protein